jgi:hypothetical protein
MLSARAAELDRRLGGLAIAGVDHRLRKPAGEDVDAWINRDALLEHHARPAPKARDELLDDEDRVAGSGVPAEDDDQSVESVGLERTSRVRRGIGGYLDLERPPTRGGEPADEPAEQPPMEQLEAFGVDEAAGASGRPEQPAHDQCAELVAEVGET